MFVVWHLLRPCSAHPTLLPKPELVLGLAKEALKSHPWWKLVFSKNASLEFIPCNFVKNELHHKDYLAWALQGSLIFWKTFFEVSLYFFIHEVITLLKGLELAS